jgi:hypothetical protein
MQAKTPSREDHMTLTRRAFAAAPVTIGRVLANSPHRAACVAVGNAFKLARPAAKYRLDPQLGGLLA